jgi:acetylglutamate kinase
VDFGLVGRVQRIESELIEHLWSGGYTPVVNTLGIAGAGTPDQVGEAPLTRQVFNINADTVSSAIAGALRADHLFLMTGVPGVLQDKDDPSTRIQRLGPESIRKAVDDGVIVGGMIPKVEEALRNLGLGIGAIHILGAGEGSLHGEATSPGSRGTVISSEG